MRTISPQARADQRGLTLPELLIALMIFAMISSAGVYALRLAIEGRAQLAEADDRLREWHVTRATLRDDLAHFARRTPRNATGLKARGPFVGGGAFDDRPAVIGETPLAGFVRRGWINVDAAKPRSQLQYVEYVKVNDALVRRVRVYVDAAPDINGEDERARDVVLVDRLTEARMTFLAGQGAAGFQWTDDWPAPAVISPAPLAVRLTTHSDDLGEIDQLFWIGSAGSAIQGNG